MKNIFKKITILFGFNTLVFTTFLNASYSINSENKNFVNNFPDTITSNLKENRSSKKTTILSNDFLWAGKALQYFLYKHTTFDEYTGTLKKSLNLTSEQELYYLMSLSSNTILVSLNGMTSYQDFFSQAFSKWLNYKTVKENLTWELLNYFFTNLYTNLKIKLAGQDSFDKTKEIIDRDFDSNSKCLIYSFTFNSLENQNLLTSRDLFYDSENFGIANSDSSYLPYAQNLLISSYKFALSNGDLRINNKITSMKSLADKIVISNYCNGKMDDCLVKYEKLKTWNNSNYIKASDESISKFQIFLSQNIKFKNFDELDKYYSDITHNRRKNPGANITLSIVMKELAKVYKWSEERLENLKNTILNIFNICYKLTFLSNNIDDFSYAIIGMIFTPDEKLLLSGEQESDVESYTGYSFIKSRFNGIYESAGYCYLIFAINYIDSNNAEAYSTNYKIGKESNPSPYVNFNKEFGKVLDSYLGRTKEGANYLIQSYPETSFKMNNSVLYKGKIIGWNEHSGEVAQSVTKNILLAIYLFITFLSIVFIIIILAISVPYFVKRYKNRDKTAFKK
ncbi:hypothetical protein SCORR_v1c08990 [Spiroplasma corruscae]|uniref:Uncharacterized protein n=1 Tax=Spiroplasma corruscae TaxID=216934 RepID=A0A222EQL2_9MOLU|nr:hypothetical protein [Spiroplasma corruscae]ASP28671.1 hypothetical protein SCORR_v1c08990 [Spiroplasma corruscae]